VISRAAREGATGVDPEAVGGHTTLFDQSDPCSDACPESFLHAAFRTDDPERSEASSRDYFHVDVVERRKPSCRY